ncbi:MAG TPA: CCA tRNA nucleotidyltransferase [Helicobacteraceae bacterium]|nr:CCA tRNA nucleotidyltransferase [Helicobacteraceae bacterium]
MHAFEPHLPPDVTKICSHLIQKGMRPVIVGGYVRDTLLGIASKDIDIEVYETTSLETLASHLNSFGSLNHVGKHFGVLKLTTEHHELDFSLPRLETKTGLGHKGFEVTTPNQIDFTQAALRRDFTINAMGYDVHAMKLLDPYKGQKDLQEGWLRCVNTKTFIEDPLRILRAVGFSARFNLQLDSHLKTLIISMHEQHALDELPKERVNVELSKLLLKALHPSYGFLAMQSLQLLDFIPPLNTLSDEDFNTTLQRVDYLNTCNIASQNTHLTYALTLLTLCFNKKTSLDAFIKKFTHNTTILKNVLVFQDTLKHIQEIHDFNDTTLRILSTQMPLCHVYALLQCINKESLALKIKQQAKKLGIFEKAPRPLLQGRHLIQEGYKPSDQFKTILNKAYQYQLEGKLTHLEDALEWLKTLKM